jgi:hypothetical protein
MRLSPQRASLLLSSLETCLEDRLSSLELSKQSFGFGGVQPEGLLSSYPCALFGDNSPSVGYMPISSGKFASMIRGHFPGPRRLSQFDDSDSAARAKGLSRGLS